MHQDISWRNKSSLHLLKITHINKNETVLDLGTGIGVQAIFAAEQAASVVATDTEELAVANARYNIRYHKLEGKIEVRKGSLFEPIKADEKFDVIIFSPEYPYRSPKNTKEILDGSFKNPDWKLIIRFFKNAGEYLKEDGRIYYILCRNRNMVHIKKIITTNKLKVKRADTIMLGDQMLTAFEITPVN